MTLPTVYADAFDRLTTFIIRTDREAWDECQKFMNAPPGTVFKFGKIPCPIRIIPRYTDTSWMA
jgi:hypothetical protein